MTFESLFACPEALPLLLVGPAAWVALRAIDGWRVRRLARVVGPRVETLARDFSPGRRQTRRWLTVGALLLASVAALQPMWGEASSSVEQRGVDILICLDVSRSMLARDLAPDRLRRARAEIRGLAERARGDRIGLVAFAGEARLVAPLTQDLGSLVEILELVDPLTIEKGGTDLGSALEIALAGLRGASGDHETVLLLTDGEDLGGRGLEVARRCRERGITVHAVGFGSALGAKIPIDRGGREGYLRDRLGKEVISALDPTSLRLIAETTGGAYVSGSRVDPLVELYERRILPMARKAFEFSGRCSSPSSSASWNSRCRRGASDEGAGGLFPPGPRWR